MRKVWGVEVLDCPCGGKRKFVEEVCAKEKIRPTLERLGLWREPPGGGQGAPGAAGPDVRPTLQRRRRRSSGPGLRRVAAPACLIQPGFDARDRSGGRRRGALTSSTCGSVNSIDPWRPPSTTVSTSPPFKGFLKTV
jgi:hypothetical protein